MKCCKNKNINKILYIVLAITIIAGIYYSKKTSKSLENKEIESKVESQS